MKPPDPELEDRLLALYVAARDAGYMRGDGGVLLVFEGDHYVVRAPRKQPDVLEWQSHDTNFYTRKPE